MRTSNKNIVMASLSSTGTWAKVLGARTTEALAIYSTLTDKAIDSSDYIADKANNKTAHAFNYQRAKSENIKNWDRLSNLISGAKEESETPTV